MTNPIVKEHNIETGEIVERPMSDVEFEAWTANANEAEELKIKTQALENARQEAQAKLLALGLTEADLIAMGLMPKPVEPE